MSTQDGTQPTLQQDTAVVQSVAATDGSPANRFFHVFRAGGVWVTSAALFAASVIIAALTGEWLVR